MEDPDVIYKEEGKSLTVEEAREFADRHEILNRTEEELKRRKQESSKDTDIGKIEEEVRGKFYKEQTEGIDTEDQSYNRQLIEALHTRYPSVLQVEYEKRPCLIVPMDTGLNKRTDVVADASYWVLTPDAIYAAHFGTVVPESALNSGGKALLKGIADEVRMEKDDWHRSAEEKKNITFNDRRLTAFRGNEPFVDMAEMRRCGFGTQYEPVCAISTVDVRQHGTLDSIKKGCEGTEKRYTFIKGQEEAVKREKEKLLSEI